MQRIDVPRAREGPPLDELTGGLGLPEHDPAHAPGKRRLARATAMATPPSARVARSKHQPWVPTSGLVGRKRRSARRG